MNVYNCIFDFYEKPTTKELYPEINVTRDSFELESENVPSDDVIKAEIQKRWAQNGKQNLIIDAILVPELAYTL
ncbi:hypothetical protein [Belliella pelovolcani]|uniref:hypothetical protein n=1 Tax=Belliella pelovolcani TaxID=529505 RepID=UPI003919F145